MAQKEVLDALKEWRIISDEWLTSSQVYNRLYSKVKRPPQKATVINSLYKLASWNIIEWRGIGIYEHRKEFRGKKTRLNNTVKA